MTSTYMLAALFTGVLVTVTRVIEFLSAVEELAHHRIWATAHDGATPTAERSRR